MYCMDLGGVEVVDLVICLMWNYKWHALRTEEITHMISTHYLLIIGCSITRKHPIVKFYIWYKSHLLVAFCCWWAGFGCPWTGFPCVVSPFADLTPGDGNLDCLTGDRDLELVDRCGEAALEETSIDGAPATCGDGWQGADNLWAPTGIGAKPKQNRRFK